MVRDWILASAAITLVSISLLDIMTGSSGSKNLGFVIPYLVLDSVMVVHSRNQWLKGKGGLYPFVCFVASLFLITDVANLATIFAG